MFASVKSQSRNVVIFNEASDKSHFCSKKLIECYLTVETDTNIP